MAKIRKEYEFNQGKNAAIFARRVLRKIDTPVKEIVFKMNEMLFEDEKIDVYWYYKRKQGVLDFPAQLIPHLKAAVKPGEREIIDNFLNTKPIKIDDGFTTRTYNMVKQNLRGAINKFLDTEIEIAILNKGRR